jgi:hypothetical protein
MATKAVKLTDKQKEIIKKLRDGWELHRINRSWYLSHYSKVGQPIFVNGNSAHFIKQKGLIEEYTMGVEKWYGYALSELGKTIDLT